MTWLTLRNNPRANYLNTTVFSNVCQIIISPYFIYVPMKFRLVLSTEGFFKTFFCVTSYSCSIDQIFLEDAFVWITNETGFYWYCKWRGKSPGLKSIFHLNNDNNCILNILLTPLDLDPELVYTGAPVTWVMPLSPIKEKKYSQASIPPLYGQADRYCIIS